MSGKRFIIMCIIGITGVLFAWFSPLNNQPPLAGPTKKVSLGIFEVVSLEAIDSSVPGYLKVDAHKDVEDFPVLIPDSVSKSELGAGKKLEVELHILSAARGGNMTRLYIGTPVSK